MMISEQWKAVCCNGGECVEQKWISWNSEVLTALLIQQFLGMFTRQQKASFSSIVPLCLSDRLSVRISAVPTGRTYVKLFGGFS